MPLISSRLYSFLCIYSYTHQLSIKPQIHPQFARVGYLLPRFEHEHLLPILEQQLREVHVGLVEVTAQLYGGPDIRHLQLRLDDGRRDFRHVLGQVQTGHVLRVALELRAAEVPDLLDERGVLLQARVQLAEGGLARPLRVLVGGAQLRLGGEALLDLPDVGGQEGPLFLFAAVVLRRWRVLLVLLLL